MTFMEEKKLEFDVGDLLWYVNGQGFGFDFISTPKEPKLERWGEIRDKVFKKEKEEIPYYGVFENGNTVWPFVAIIHRDLNRPDNTPGRVIIHKIIWVPPNLKGKDPKEAVSDIPHDWFQQVWKAGLDNLYAEVYSLNKEGACKRVRERLLKIQLQPSSESHENWIDVGVISSDKPAEREGERLRRQTETDSETKKKVGDPVCWDSSQGKTDLLVRGTFLVGGSLAGGWAALLIPPVGVVSSVILFAAVADKIYNRLLKK